MADDCAFIDGDSLLSPAFDVKKINSPMITFSHGLRNPMMQSLFQGDHT